MCKFFFIFFYNCESSRKILTAGRITNNCSGSGSGRLTVRSVRYICESFSLFPPRMFPHLARSARIGHLFPEQLFGCLHRNWCPIWESPDQGERLPPVTVLFPRISHLFAIFDYLNPNIFVWRYVTHPSNGYILKFFQFFNDLLSAERVHVLVHYVLFVNK